MKKLLILILSITTFGAIAQDTATVTWMLNATTTITSVTSGGVDAKDQTVTSEYIIRDYAGMEESQRVYAAGSGLGYWPNESAENMERYCEFKVTAKNGVVFKPTNITLSLGNSGGSSSVKASVYISVDDFATSVKIDDAIALPSKDLITRTYHVDTLNVEFEPQEFFTIRVYVWLTGGVASGKYFNINDVQIKGITIGEVIPDPATIKTIVVSHISTTSAITGGSITNDGGALITERGMCYGKSAGVDTSHWVILNGEGIGKFEMQLTNLEKHTKYYVKAYAINAAGVSYGDELSFTTLENLSIPLVITNSISELRPTSAVSGGNVTFDGGLEVTMRGICWNTQASPTTLDFKVESGSGLGSYKSYMGQLTAETKYYVRAFAQNNEGIAYGQQIEYETPAPADEIKITVDLNGSGDYSTIQEAFNAVPLNYQGPITIFVKKGIYNEKVILEKNKINVNLIGESRDNTIITYDDYSGKVVDGITLGTSTSYSVAVDADDFIAQNITFQNTYNGSQAVALRVKGDRMIFHNCNLLGNQDTYYTWGRGRVYHKNCYIEGTVDFIFGASVAYFDDCTIKSKRDSPITAASTELGFDFGYVFSKCMLTAESGINGVTLGRPWGPYAKTVFINTEEGKHISSSGWSIWEGTQNHTTAYYAEYNCTGEGFKPESRVDWSQQLTETEAQNYSVENIFSKESGNPDYNYNWMPVYEPVISSIKTGDLLIDKFKLFPNPSAGNFTLCYNLTIPSDVTIEIFNSKGQLLKILSINNQSSGLNHLQIDGSNFESGLYVLRVKTNAFVNTIQLIKE